MLADKSTKTLVLVWLVTRTLTDTGTRKLVLVLAGDQDTGAG